MATHESTSNRPSGIASLFTWVFCSIGAIGMLVVIYVLWPAVVARYTGVTNTQAQATATATRPFPTTAALSGSGSAARDPIAVATPIPGLAQNEATATAQYNEAVQRSQNGAVVLPANDPQPVQLVQQPAERQPAGDNVPTAEPVVEGAPVVNIQETHECKHGQVWTDAGCRNPDSKGSKSRP